VSRIASVLVRREYVCKYETGERSLPAPDRVLRYGRPALLPLSTIACVAADQPVVSLTYDDGPDPAHTPRVLDALARHGMQATFFVMVGRAERHRTLVRRIQDEGHEVALHGIDHTRLSQLPPRRAVALIRDAKSRLEAITGRRCPLFRPTYGAQTMGQLVGTRALGMEVVVWSAWTRDWDGSPPEVIAERGLQALHHGGFVLMHDASGDGVGTGMDDAAPGAPAASTASAGPVDRGRAADLLLAGMAERGYTSRTVSDLLATYPAVRTIWT
jgi:peptidoglycan/xylan/chitin deacetylase (PgdA/CDA1 family)